MIIMARHPQTSTATVHCTRGHVVDTTFRTAKEISDYSFA
jgi:hypothetical protein